MLRERVFHPGGSLVILHVFLNTGACNLKLFLQGGEYSFFRARLTRLRGERSVEPHEERSATHTEQRMIAVIRLLVLVRTAYVASTAEKVSGTSDMTG